ncbi:hypothetical protein A0H81_03011 [Grifola frondosa]|uniref:Uncharacterized protein n=1 Tax=Grifola frondosa TaxID=5627 RepID=A0A1C7MJN9_GRIFR|nr:hypothetical protein A0H81_03011 [Grifola frondosa]
MWAILAVRYRLEAENLSLDITQNSHDWTSLGVHLPADLLRQKRTRISNATGMSTALATAFWLKSTARLLRFPRSGQASDGLEPTASQFSQPLGVWSVDLCISSEVNIMKSVSISVSGIPPSSSYLSFSYRIPEVQARNFQRVSVIAAGVLTSHMSSALKSTHLLDGLSLKVALDVL